MQPFQDKVYSSRKEFAHKRANSFLYELTPNEMSNIKIKDLLPLKVYIHIHFDISSHSKQR